MQKKWLGSYCDSQITEKWETGEDSTQTEKPLHGACATKIPKTGVRLEVFCKGVILSCPVQSQQKYLSHLSIFYRHSSRKAPSR